MARNHGLIEVAANFEPLKKQELDARESVDTFTDLTNPVTWQDSEGNERTYLNMRVFIKDEKARYMLNATDYTVAGNWEIVSGAGSSPILTTQLDITGTIAPNTTLDCTSNGTNYTKRLSDPKLGATNTIFLDSGNIRIVVSGLECRKGIDVLRVSNTQLQFNLTLSNTDRVVIKS